MSSQITFESIHKASYDGLLNQFIKCVVDLSASSPGSLTAEQIRSALKMPSLTNVMPPVLNGGLASSSKKRSKCNGPPCQYIPGRGNKKGMLCGQNSPDNIPVCRSHRNTKGGKDIMSKYSNGTLTQSPDLPNLVPTGIKQAPQRERQADHEMDVLEDPSDGSFISKVTPTIPYRFIILTRKEGDNDTHYVEKIRVIPGDPTSDRKLTPVEAAFAQNIGLNLVNATVPAAAVTQTQSALGATPSIPNLSTFSIPSLPQLTPVALSNGSSSSETSGIQIPDLPVLSTS